MRIHKVYNRISSLSSSSPFLSTLSIGTLKPLLKRNLVTKPIRFSMRSSPSSSSSSSNRFHNLVPVKAAAASAVGGGGGAENSSLHGSHTAITYEEEDELAIGGGYRLPPPEIKDIVDAPPLPALSFSPKRDKILFLKRRALPPLSDLAKPEEKLAGVRIDGKCNTRSRMSSYTGIGIHQLLPDGMLGPEKEIHGFPDGAKINFVSWSPDGRHLSFSIRFEEENGSSKLRVWVADVETGKANPVFQSPDIYLNAIFDNFVWVNDSTLLVCTIPLSRGDPPKKPIVPSGPKIQSNEQKSIIQVRTFQDLLKDEYDEDLFDYYTTTQLVLASLDGTVKEIGSPGIYTSMDPSPDEKYVLISSLHRPYSFIVPCGRFPKKVELWTTDGQFVREICDLPLAEDIPIAFNSVRKGMRSINWRADKPSQLYWVETQDGGDAKVEVSPRDIIFTQRADAPDGVEPEILHKLDLRYGGISWCDDSLALVYESWYKTRRTRTWVISPGSEDVSPRILFDRSSEDVYSDPGSPMSRRTPAETYVIAKVNKENDGNTYFLLNGSGATPEGNVPFLDLFDINSGTKERIWQSDKDKYFETVVALMSDQNEGDLHLDQLKILTSKESKTENTQYYMQTWPDKKACQITNFPHPYPQLATLQKEMIRYTRKDGVQLTATLYLPPGYDASKDGPLPCLFWSYPGEFKSKEAAGQVRGSPNEFSGIGPTSALLWLARRFAILSGPTIPIIGEGDEEANDRYVEQLVTSAEAAVEEVIRRGVAHPNKIAVGGHSYGAFMTANLLAHAPHLFSCGIARSGAYNRTLTPFGFQNEERTLWDAPKTYSEMSPFMAANKIKKPILLIHGEEDNNSGTLTMQSDRFFNALKGHGALSRLVILPFESHGYAARESIMHVLWESDRWLQKYCVSNTSNVNEDLDSSKDNLSKETTNSESKPASVSGGGSSEQTDDEHGAFPYLPRSLLCWTINTKYYSADVSVWMAHLHEGFSINALPIYDRLAALVMVFDTNDLLSLSALKEWVSHTDIHKFDILLCIGNKVDLLQGHSAHAEYRRRLLKKSKNSSTKSYEEVEYGISETEGSSLLGEEETSLDFRDSCLEWCSEHGIEYIEACASNAYFDKCLSVDGDSQGVDRLYGALSAHMWPGMILKSGNKILEPSLPEYEDSSEEDSDVDFDYEVLSAGSVEQWDETDEGWVSATASTSTGEPVIQNDNVKVFGKEQEPVIVSNNEDKKPSTSADQLQGGDIDESEAPKLHETDSDTESRQGTNINIEDLEQLMSEISNTRDSLRLMPDFQRREMAAKLAMKMASMFGGSDDDDER